MATKQFHLGHILSITTGALVTPDGTIDGVYEILNFMTNDDLFTHQLPRAADECKPYLLDQFPQLAGITSEGINPHTWRAWLADKVAKFGERFDVAPISIGDHDVIDPIVEFKRMTGRDPISIDGSPESIADLIKKLASDDESEAQS